MKKKLIFLGSLGALTLALFAGKDMVAGFYDAVLLNVTALLLPEDKRTFEIYQLILGISRKTSVSIIVLFSLLMTTPTIRLRKRLGMFGLGSLAFVLFDLISLLFWPVGASGQCAGGAVDNPYVSNIFIRDFFTHWVFPLLLWFVAVHRQLGEMFAVPASAEVELVRDRCPLCGMRRKGVLAHVRGAHGEAALDSDLVKRYSARFGRRERDA